MSVPRISLVIPAHNEALLLPALLDTVDAALARWHGAREQVEVIVADNQSTDATATIALARGCRVVPVEKRAIAAARNGGAAAATGEIIAFIDADSRIHPETFNVVDGTMRDARVVVGASGVWPDRWSLGIFFTFLAAWPVILVCGVDTGVVFCRREDFNAVGGYDESLQYAEDLRFMFDLKRLGRPRGQRFRRVMKIAAITSTRKFDKHGHWHYFTQMPVVGFWMMFDKSKVEKFTSRYWYEDR